MKKFSLRSLVVTAGLVMAVVSTAIAPHAQAAPVMADATAPPVAIAAQPGVNGYTLLDANGNVYAFGTQFYGSAGKDRVAPFVSMAYTPSGRGYALLDSQGHVYNYGDSYWRGGTPAGASLPFVSIAYKPGTLGYTLMDSRGHIYNYGTDYIDGPHDYNQTYTAMAYTPSGRGYTLLSRTGGIYAYGDAQYKGGSPGGATLPFRGLAYKPGTLDYTLTDAVGHVYNYGTQWLGGNPAGSHPDFVGLVHSPSGNGYAMVDAIGNAYAYGDSIYQGGFRSIGTVPAGTGVVGDVFADSTGVGCAAGTRDLGLANGYHSGTLVRIRLCAIPNLSSSSEESTPGSAYYVANANGQAITNSRVSGAIFAMVASAKNARLSVSASSTFRTMAHQQALCNANSYCRNGNYTYVAKPGTSNHQMGLAIDFAGITAKGGSTCTYRATQTSSSLWVWLRDHAASYGFHQYSAEAWHWDVLSGGNRC